MCPAMLPTLCDVCYDVDYLLHDSYQYSPIHAPSPSLDRCDYGALQRVAIHGHGARRGVDTRYSHLITPSSPYRQVDITPLPWNHRISTAHGYHASCLTHNSLQERSHSMFASTANSPTPYCRAPTDGSVRASPDFRDTGKSQIVLSRSPTSMTPVPFVQYRNLISPNVRPQGEKMLEGDVPFFRYLYEKGYFNGASLQDGVDDRGVQGKSERLMWSDDLRRWIQEEQSDEEGHYISFVNTATLQERRGAHHRQHLTVSRKRSEDGELFCGRYMGHFGLTAGGKKKKKRLKGEDAAKANERKMLLLQRMAERARLLEEERLRLASMPQFTESQKPPKVIVLKKQEKTQAHQKEEKVVAILEQPAPRELESLKRDETPEILPEEPINVLTEVPPPEPDAEEEEEEEEEEHQQEEESQLDKPPTPHTSPPPENIVETEDAEEVSHPTADFVPMELSRSEEEQPERESSPATPAESPTPPPSSAPAPTLKAEPPAPLMFIESIQEKKPRPPVQKKVRIAKTRSVVFIPPVHKLPPTPPAGVRTAKDWLFDEDFSEPINREDVPPLPPPPPAPATPPRTPSAPPSAPEPAKPKPQPKRNIPLPKIPDVLKKRWGEKQRDHSYAEWLEKQRLADERHRRLHEMTERWRSRSRQEPSPPLSPTGGVPRFHQYGFLSQYCILNRLNMPLFKTVFKTVDEERKGWLTYEQLQAGLRAVNPELKDSEKLYIRRVMELCEYDVTRGADFQLFATLSALSLRISSVEDWLKNLIHQAAGFRQLEVKLLMCKYLWEMNVNKGSRTIPVNELCVELTAGGVTEEHVEEVFEELGCLGEFDLIDFLTYIPLFILMHESIVQRPLEKTRTI